MAMRGERLLSAVTCLEPVYSDGVLGFMNYGQTFGTVYYRYVPVKVENGQILYEQVPFMNVVRPIASLGACNLCHFRREVEASFMTLVGNA